MRTDSTQADGSVVLAAGSVGNVGAGQADGAVALRPLAPIEARLRWPRARVAMGPIAGRVALASLILGALAVVVFATAAPSPLVPRSYLGFPHWESGPLHGLFGHITNDSNALNLGLSAIVLAMTLAYGAALVSVRTMSMRVIVLCILALHAILLMSPPLQLTDLFNYLGYARLGAVHHLNPYTHGMLAEMHDPIYRFTTWHNLNSPYGPLFTIISYPIALLPVPVAYWTLKLMAVLGSLAFIALVWKIARLLGRDPRFAVLFVAANPIYLMFAVAGFHNDFVMLVPSTAAVALLLARRDRAAGAAVMFAVAVKFTAVLLLPFLLIAARPPRRRLRVLAGAALATVPLVAVSIATFGFTLPNLSDQSTLLTDFSIPNLVGLALGIGGATPALLRVANVALVLVVVLFLRRKRDWLSGAGWSTLALIASLAWLVPWYVIWVLPLAALSTSVRLRRATLAFTVFLVLAFIPATGIFLRAHGIDPLGTAVGQASRTLQNKLER
jgi:Glycosyltransferase family 87